MRIIAAPDSFKGNINALEAAVAIERGIRRFDPDIEVIKIPMADGGEGTVEAAAAAAGAELIRASVSDPLGRPVEAIYAILPDGLTAVIEMSAASGLPLLNPSELNPLITSTVGTGELIRDALDRGCRKIILGIGGSATTDGGIGAASVFGITFLDSLGNRLEPIGQSMESIAAVDLSQRDSRLEKIEVLVACDVSNPFYGPQGAAHVYGPQKGADPVMVEVLDRGLKHLAEVIEAELGIDIAWIPGAGAAGGLGGGMVAFFGAQLQSGIEIMIDAVGFEAALPGTDLVITGEGKTDFQTAYGKVPAGVAAAAKKQGIPVVCFSGALGKNIEELYAVGITALFSTANREMTLEYAIEHSQELLEQGAEQIVRLFASGRHRTGN